MAVLPDPPWADDGFAISNYRRQNTPEGNNTCSFVDNSVYSCFPTSSTKVFQNTSIHFVWNPKQPSFAQFNRVDVYLKHQDTLQLADSQIDIQNQPGRTSFAVNDSWWDVRGNSFDGKNISYPMYFLVVAHGARTETAVPQSTFTAIQTRLPDRIVSLQAAQSSAAAASSSEAAQSLSSVLATATLSPGATPPPGAPSSTSSSGSVQSNGGGGGFPAWAIALLVIFGTLALVFVLLAIFLGLRRYKRRQNASRNGSARESMGSHTPMMAEVAPTGGHVSGEEPGSPGAVSSSQGHQSFIPPGALGVAGAAGSSRAGSTHTKDTDGPFSGADAAIMAAAFRDRLRKPDFADRPLEEGESPDRDGGDSEEERELFLQSQLKEEGKDLRSVSSVKGVKVHGEPSEVDNGSMSTFHGGHTTQRHGDRDFDPPNVDIG